VAAAAFQIAVWEIEYDGGNQAPGTGEAIPGAAYFTSGILKVTASGSSSNKAHLAITEATSWLNSLTAASTLASNTIALGDYYANRTQDQLTVVPAGSTPNHAVVPFPSALVLGASMLAVMGVVRRMRRKGFAA
jgi:hypothetical protein